MCLIPLSEHISRYCRPSTLSDSMPLPTAFMLRRDEESLSADWLEFMEKIYGKKDNIQITKTFKRRGFSVNKKGKYAVFNVGDLIKYVEHKTPDNRKLIVKHEPRNPKDSHSSIFNSKHEENLISVLMSQAIKRILSIE